MRSSESSPRLRRTPPIWTAALAAALLLGAVLYVRLQIAAAWGGRHNNDFKHIYAGAWLLARGLSPYDRTLLFQAAEEAVLPPDQRGQGRLALNPYVYFPFTALVMAPLTALDFFTASAVWFVVNHLCLLLAAAVMLRALRFEPWWGGAAILALLLGWNFPLTRNLTAGQLNAPLLLMEALALGALLREGELVRRPGPKPTATAGLARRLLNHPRFWAAVAGFALAFAAWFKISPGLFVFFLLLKRRWRALGWMLAWGTVLGAFALLAAGPAVHRDFLPLLRQMRYGHSTWEDLVDSATGEPRVTFYRDPGNQSLNALMHHLVAGGGGFEPLVRLGAKAADALTVAGAIILLWMGVGPIRRTNRERIEREAAAIEAGASEVPPPADAALEPPEITVLDFSSFLLLSLFLPSLMWDHYLVQAVLPVLGLAWTLLRARRPRNESGVQGELVAHDGGGALPWWIGAGLAAAWTTIGLPQAWGSAFYKSGPGLLLGHAKFFALLLVFALILDARARLCSSSQEAESAPSADESAW
ncbi:MAG: hypothetical protein Kow0059_13350 [Candidatus Sumerlaeia bacterium]